MLYWRLLYHVCMVGLLAIQSSITCCKTCTAGVPGVIYNVRLKTLSPDSHSLSHTLMQLCSSPTLSFLMGIWLSWQWWSLCQSEQEALGYISTSTEHLPEPQGGHVLLIGRRSGITNMFCWVVAHFEESDGLGPYYRSRVKRGIGEADVV